MEHVLWNSGHPLTTWQIEWFFLSEYIHLAFLTTLINSLLSYHLYIIRTLFSFFSQSLTPSQIPKLFIKDLVLKTYSPFSFHLAFLSTQTPIGAHPLLITNTCLFSCTFLDHVPLANSIYLYVEYIKARTSGLAMWLALEGQ